MSQEFNKVSTTSNFIKNLLISTYLPLIRTVRDYDYILANRLYVYKCNIIKCNKSGYIVTGYQHENFKGDRAQFRILSEYYFGEQNDKLCTNYISNSEGYDSLTHERLGKYLRSLSDMYDLNLMPLYNCFSNNILQGHHIVCKGNWQKDKVEKTSDDYGKKVYKIPIRFNTDYTICMENLGVTTFAPAFIKNSNLVKLNNSRFGNDVDVTNKYAKLYRTDVIFNMPGLRFLDPVKIRFNNVPVTRHVKEYKRTPLKLDTLHDEELYKPWTSASMPRARYYIRNAGFYEIESLTEEEYNLNPWNYYYNDNGVLVPCDATIPFDPTNIYYVYDSSQNRVTFLPTDLTPETTDIPLYTGVEPLSGRGDSALASEKEYLIYDPDTDTLIQNMSHTDKAIITMEGKILKLSMDKERVYDTAGYETVCLWRRLTDDDTFDPEQLYYYKEGGIFYEWHFVVTEEYYDDNITKLYIRRWDESTHDWKYIRCDRSGEPYDPDEIYYVSYLDGYITAEEYYFIYNTTEFYIALGFSSDPSDYYKIVDNQLVECSIHEVFDMNTSYAIKKPVEFYPWRVPNPDYDPTQEEGPTNKKFLDSSDEYIVEGKTYYSQYDMEEEIPIVYDITEENCAMYEYLEDNLYLLIQVDKDFDSNILVLEGDYTHTYTPKIIDDSMVDSLPRPVIDYLYTSNLKLMKIPTKKIIPFSSTLVEFLLWNAINNLDSLNNNLDRLILAINVISPVGVNGLYPNYWYPGMRKLVYDIADKQNNDVVDDNLGYVTKDIEKVINTTMKEQDYINDYVEYVEEEFEDRF